MDALTEPEPKLPAEPIPEMFAFDTGTAAATPFVRSEDIVDAIFSNDPDAKPQTRPSPPPPVERPLSPPPIPVEVGSADFFSLDLDEVSPPAPAMAARMQPQAAQPKVVSAPTPPVTLSVEEPITVTKPARNGRPDVKITLLLPGQKSPLEK